MIRDVMRILHHYFASAQIVGYVPDSKIWRVLKFVSCADVRCKLL